MGKHAKLYRHILILILMIFLTIGIVSWNNAGKLYFAAEDTQYMQDAAGKLELLVYMDDKLFVKWWKNNSDNSYCIFLPGAVKGKKQSLRLIGGGGIYVMFI